MTDQENLIARIHDGQADALAEYVEQQRASLLAIIMRKMSGGLRSKIESEDILQEVCSSAMQSLEEVDFQQRDPFVWLCHLIDRRIVDAHRRFNAQKRAAAQEIRLHSAENSQDDGGIIGLLVASVTSPSMAFSRQRKESALWTALRQLPEDQQEALTMRYVQNLPSKQIAERLGKSDGAVRVMLTRAIKRLEELMQSPGESSAT